jgi:environmental stress-induced protein Ves
VLVTNGKEEKNAHSMLTECAQEQYKQQHAQQQHTQQQQQQLLLQQQYAQQQYNNNSALHTVFVQTHFHHGLVAHGSS